MTRFLAADPGQLAVEELDFEVLLRAAVFKSTNQLMGYLFQKLADRIDAAYQPKPGYVRKGRVPVTIDCIFGSLVILRDYYYHEGKQLGHYPTDAALGLEGGKTPALARLVCLEGADQDSYQQAQEHLKETGGIDISARQIQRLVQQAGAAAQTWQEREALKPLPESKPVPVFYVSAERANLFVGVYPCSIVHDHPGSRTHELVRPPWPTSRAGRARIWRRCPCRIRRSPSAHPQG